MGSTNGERQNLFYLIFAYVCVALGIIGAFLPVMPTTPFLIVAAWAAAKGSPKLHKWLYEHKIFGPALIAWDEKRTVATTAKWTACVFMTGSWLIIFYFSDNLLVPIFAGAILLSVGTYLATRPTP